MTRLKIQVRYALIHKVMSAAALTWRSPRRDDHRRLQRLAKTFDVLRHHSEIVLGIFRQVRHRLRRGVRLDASAAHPVLTRQLATLNDVAGDGDATVIARRVP